LSQPHLEKQVFAVQLASYLCEKFPLQRCIDIAYQAIGRIRQIGKLTGSFTLKSVDSSSSIAGQSGSTASASTVSNSTNSRQNIQQGTVLTKATKLEYTKAIVELLDTLIRFVVAFPFLSVECIQVLEEVKTNFKNDDLIRHKVQSVFSQLTDTVIENAKK
jgi:hypothetical protein